MRRIKGITCGISLSFMMQQLNIMFGKDNLYYEDLLKINRNKPVRVMNSCTLRNPITSKEETFLYLRRTIEQILFQEKYFLLFLLF